MKTKTAYHIYILTLLIIIHNFAQSTSNKLIKREIGNLVLENIPEIPRRIQERMLQYQNVRAAEFQDWDPRGRGMLITTRFGEVTQLHYVATPGGMRRQITFFDEPVYFGRFCPDPARNGFLFTKDTGGNEQYQIYYYNCDNGTHTMLTGGTAKNGEVVWSNKGDRFAYFSTKRNGRDWDVYISAIDKPEKSKCIVKKEGVWVPVRWSPEDDKLLVQHYVSANESYLHWYDFTKRKLVPVNRKKKKIAYGGAVWAADGKGLFVTANDDCEFLSLHYYSLKKRKMRIITQDIPWNIVDHAISRDGKQVAFATNEHGFSRLYLCDTKSLQYKEVPNLPVGRIYGLYYSPDGKKMSLVISPAKSPADVYTLTLADITLTRWTFSEVSGLPVDQFANPAVVYYKTFDYVNNAPRKIPALYYKPKIGKTPHPVLIYIHGGPESQYWPQFSSRIQYLVTECGIAVVAPNVRGSAGYGKTYLDLDNGYHRDKTVRDIGTLLDWIEKQPELDRTRVGVIGGSYGGYMALASMAAFNKRLACGIDIYGISNFITFLKHTKDYRRDLRRVEYGDERDPAMRKYLQSISPVTHCKKIEKPLVIVQGANDPRVPASESAQMVAEIRKNNGTVWYLLAKDEGHGFGKKSNRDVAENVIVMFLETYLMNK